jgi:NTE family protein
MRLLMIAWHLMRDMEVALRVGVRVHLAPALCPLVVSPYDFSATPELIERGARSTRHWIDRGGLERQADPQELAAHGH